MEQNGVIETVLGICHPDNREQPNSKEIKKLDEIWNRCIHMVYVLE